MDQGKKRHDQLNALEARVAGQQEVLKALESVVAEVRITLQKLQDRVSEIRQKTTATCESCSIEFDLLANHYSIGLFDNIVYVKCPRCNKALPVDSRDGLKKP